MKKISILMACLVAMLSFSSCNDDTTPRLEKDPATLKFTVNTPPMANQYFELSNDGTFDLSCSQPDYGFSAVTNYVVLVSLSPEFKHNAKEVHAGESEYFPQAGDYVELRDAGTKANMQVKDLYLTRAINKLLTFKNAEGVESKVEDVEDMAEALAQNYPGQEYIPVYIKIRAYIPQDPAMSSVISSNYVTLSKVKPFFSLEVPSSIYLTGDFNGFLEPKPDNIPAADAAGYPQVEGKLWPLTELDSEIDSKIFRASFWLVNQNENDAFRLYQIPPAAGWGATGSLGGSLEDFSSVNLGLEDGVAKSSVVEGGQGNWNLHVGDSDAIEAGWYDFVVDLNEMTITVTKVSEPTYPTTYQP